MKEIKKKEKLLFFILSLLLITIVGATIAYYSSKKDFENEFRVKEPGVAMEEKFNPADHWLPGEEKSKEVWFRNTGKMDMLLRFSVEVKWDDSVAHPTDIPPDQVITLNWYNGKKVKEEGKDDKDKGECNRIPATDETAPLGFEKIGNYYYYKQILKAGEPTEHTLDSVTFSPDLSNDGHQHSDYTGTKILVIIRGETILAVPEAAEEWGMKAKITGDGVEWSQ